MVAHAGTRLLADVAGTGLEVLSANGLDHLTDADLPTQQWQQLHERWSNRGPWPVTFRTVGARANYPQTAPKSEWTAEYGDLARGVWAKLNDQARALFNIRIDAPERAFDGNRLATILGMTTGRLGVSGLLSWPSKCGPGGSQDLLALPGGS